MLPKCLRFDSTADLPTISLRSLPDLPEPSPRVTFPLLKLRTHTDIMYCHLGYPRIRVFLRTEAKPYTALSPTARQAGNPPRGRCGLLVSEVSACETENKGLPLSAVSAAPSEWSRCVLATPSSRPRPDSQRAWEELRKRPSIIGPETPPRDPKTEMNQSSHPSLFCKPCSS